VSGPAVTHLSNVRPCQDAASLRDDRSDRDGTFKHDPCSPPLATMHCSRTDADSRERTSMRALKVFSVSLIIALVGAAPTMAQHSSGAEDGRTLSSAAMDAAVSGHELTVDQQRAQLAELLSRSEVREIARDRGVDMEQVETAAAGLSDNQVNQLAPLVARAAAAAQNGGLGTVTISVAAIIIILLLLILIT
jgi:hypothetical protein